MQFKQEDIYNITDIHKLTKTCITWTTNSVRESINSLCRDGADTPIVCVH